MTYKTITIERPQPEVETTEHGPLTVTHLFPCEMPFCEGVARHVSPDDGAHICDICWEIEEENRIEELARQGKL